MDKFSEQTSNNEKGEIVESEFKVWLDKQIYLIGI